MNPVSRVGPPAVRFVRQRVWPRLGHKLAVDLTRRYPPSGEVFQTREPSGMRLQCDLRDELSWNLYYVGTADAGVRAWMQSWLRPGDTYVDVGAHIGSLVSVAVDAVGPTGRVVAFEPGTQTYAKLARAASTARWPIIEAHRAAVGAAPGTASFHVPVAAAQSSRATLVGADGFNAVETVEVETVDGTLGSASVRLLKIDVEGYERSVLEGATRTLTNTDALLLEINPTALAHAGTDGDDLLALLSAFVPHTINGSGQLTPVDRLVPEGEYMDVAFLRA